jgi:hypothetical protein
MEVQGNLVVPEYQAILDQILSSYGKKKQEAEASGIGEAQRRGLINQTGTSDIEGMIRASKVAPVADAEAGAISSVYNQAAQQGASERMQGQQNDYQKMMQEYMNQYNSAESQKQRDYDMQMAQLQRSWAQSDAKKKSKNWWKDALAGTVSTAVGTGAGIGLGKLI